MRWAKAGSAIPSEPSDLAQLDRFADTRERTGSPGSASQAWVHLPACAESGPASCNLRHAAHSHGADVRHDLFALRTNAGIIDKTQFSLLVTVVVISAVVPTAIAERWFLPDAERERRVDRRLAYAESEEYV